jgi:putative transposase
MREARFSEAQIVSILIQQGKPTQNAYIERFNRSSRHEVLQAHFFGSLEDVR